MFYDYFAGPEEARRRYEIDNFPKAEEILPDNGMDAAAQAAEMAQSLGLDSAVRTIAKSGKNHDGGPNWYAEWGGMQISATFGAGTNSAFCQALIDGETTILFSASNYGGHIETFRVGPWVNRVLARAAELRELNTLKAQSLAAEETTRKLDNFKTVDF